MEHIKYFYVSHVTKENKQTIQTSMLADYCLLLHFLYILDIRDSASTNPIYVIFYFNLYIVDRIRRVNQIFNMIF